MRATTVLVLISFLLASVFSPVLSYATDEADRPKVTVREYSNNVVVFSEQGVEYPHRPVTPLDPAATGIRNGLSRIASEMSWCAFLLWVPLAGIMCNGTQCSGDKAKEASRGSSGVYAAPSLLDSRKIEGASNVKQSFDLMILASNLHLEQKIEFLDSKNNIVRTVEIASPETWSRFTLIERSRILTDIIELEFVTNPGPLTVRIEGAYATQVRSMILKDSYISFSDELKGADGKVLRESTMPKILLKTQTSEPLKK